MKKNKILSKKRKNMIKTKSSVYNTNKYFIQNQLNHLIKNNTTLFLRLPKNKTNLLTYFYLLYKNQLNLKTAYSLNTFLLKFNQSKKNNLKLHNINKQIYTYFINQLLKKGNKKKAIKIFYFMLEYIKLDQKTDPLNIFIKGIKNITPTYLPKKDNNLSTLPKAKKAIQWIFNETKKVQQKKSNIKQNHFYIKLAHEIIKAYYKKGNPYNKKIENDLQILTNTQKKENK